MSEAKQTDNAIEIAARLERVLREARKDEQRLKQILRTRRLQRRIRILTATGSSVVGSSTTPAAAH